MSSFIHSPPMENFCGESKKVTATATDSTIMAAEENFTSVVRKEAFRQKSSTTAVTSGRKKSSKGSIIASTSS